MLSKSLSLQKSNRICFLSSIAYQRLNPRSIAIDSELPPSDHRDREDLSLVLIEFSASLIAI